MRITTIKKIGRRDYAFEGEGLNVIEALGDLSKASFGDIQSCGLCNSENLYLEGHSAKGFDFASIRCASCKATLKFGSRKDDKNVSYLRRNEQGQLNWEAYDPK